MSLSQAEFVRTYLLPVLKCFLWHFMLRSDQENIISLFSEMQRD